MNAATTKPYIAESAVPVLAVADVPTSVRFYCEVLGFDRDWGGEDGLEHIASVSRDGHAIMLERRNPIDRGCVWIGVSKLAPIWERMRGRRTLVIQPPKSHYWAVDLRIKDPDGNILWFGAEPTDLIPFGKRVPASQLSSL